MFEKVNPSHPDKIADRIAGAIVDEAYRLNALQNIKNPYINSEPKIAVEVLIGHNECNIIIEKSPWLHFDQDFFQDTVNRITKEKYYINIRKFSQDINLQQNQSIEIRCGDNGIFKGCEITAEEQELTNFVNDFYKEYPSDGKFILCGNKLTICQSKLFNFEHDNIKQRFPQYDIIINPLGYWLGGPSTDSGATNRKLGSDMGHSVTGGGLHGKDLSKADVSVNIWAWLQAQKYHNEIECYCSIGDTKVNNIPYKEIVEIAREYINNIGGFEKFAEWGLIRP